MSPVYLLELSMGLFFLASLVGLFTGRRGAYLITLLASLVLFPVSVEGIRGFKGEVFDFLPTSIAVDSFSALFLLVLAFVSSAISLYLLDYEVKGSNRFLSLGTNMALLSAVLFVSTDNLERLTLAYELFAVFTAVIILASETRRSRRSAWRYLVMTQVFGIIPLLIATGLAYGAVGSLYHLTIHGLRENIGKLPVGLWLLYALYLSASLVRSGAFPFNLWVPRVYRSTPSPFVPVFIIGEGIGLYLLLRAAVFTLPPNRALGYAVAFLGTVTTFATLYSFREIRLKKKFAYHSIMDVGVSYFALGVALVLWGSMAGTVVLIGALLHTLYQIIYKSSIFFGLGAIEHYGEEPNICSLRKLLRGHVISLLIALSAFSMASFPPLASFVSKWLIYQGAMSSADVPLWLMAVTVAFLGIFPLASVLQIRRINRLLCKREVEREEIPLLIRGVTGLVSLTGFIVAVFPFMVLPWFTGALEELPIPLPHSPMELFFASPFSFLALGFLALGAIAGWKVGKVPTERVSELLLIFYNVGDILQESANFFVETGKRAYINYILPAIKVIPGHELPLIKDYDDALDYPVRHLDEAMFMPIIGIIKRLALWGRSQGLDMNALISGFAVVMALLIVLLGVFA
ncbi:complex I subunit 5 family protein [Thermococcus sp.]|uniref:complex I subunit 5 family protein n=1 Tax=Thermococcus sp. TaxID=35749 RepID=UPI00262F433C|nr:complex I subunit 5 family protein [Thermococcus sp.]